MSPIYYVPVRAVSPGCVIIMQRVKLLDASSQGQDGGVPHDSWLRSDAHGQLDLNTVHPGHSAVAPHDESSVVVAKLPGTYSSLKIFH